MDYNLNNGLLYPLWIALFPVKSNYIHFAPRPITRSKSLPNIEVREPQKELLRSKSKGSRPLSEGQVDEVVLNEVLTFEVEKKEMEVSESSLNLMCNILLIINDKLKYNQYLIRVQE